MGRLLLTGYPIALKLLGVKVSGCRLVPVISLPAASRAAGSLESGDACSPAWS
jgi:hypothetical protein